MTVVKRFIYNKMSVTTQTQICKHAQTLKPSLKQISIAVEFITGILKLQLTAKGETPSNSNTMSKPQARRVAVNSIQDDKSITPRTVRCM